jgi:cytochrome b561
MRKKITSKENSSSSGEKYFIVSPEKKKKLLGIIFIVLALLVFLSILSYSPYDESSFSFTFRELVDFIKQNSEILNRASTTHNWLGIFGAYVSHFFLNSVIGYFSVDHFVHLGVFYCKK